MTKREFLQKVAEFAVNELLQSGDLEEWLCEKNSRLKKALQLYPEAKDWTPDVLAGMILKDLPDHMHGVWETLFE